MKTRVQELNDFYNTRIILTKGLFSNVYIYVYGVVYMSAIISIRVEDEIRKDIEKLGYTPSEYIKKILIQELKRERSKKALTWLRANRLPGGKKQTQDLIRKDRDSR